MAFLACKGHPGRFFAALLNDPLGVRAGAFGLRSPPATALRAPSRPLTQESGKRAAPAMTFPVYGGKGFFPPNPPFISSLSRQKKPAPVGRLPPSPTPPPRRWQRL